MYSIVMVAMLSAADVTTTPTWGCRCCGCGCWGCHGCRGCHGCWGCHGCRGCHGCWGCHCCGCGCGCGCGCWGGGYAYGGYAYGCYGVCYGCYGCYGCGCGGYYVAYSDLRPAAARTTTSAAYEAPAMAANYASDSVPSVDRLMASARHSVEPAAAPSRNDTARITVRLPQDARLYVNGDPCTLTSDSRSFETPKLEAGRAYAYTLKTEVVRNGQTQVETKRVIFQAGRSVVVDFAEPNPIATVRR